MEFWFRYVSHLLFPPWEIFSGGLKPPTQYMGILRVLVFPKSPTLWLCQNSYCKWWFISWHFPWNMVIFHIFLYVYQSLDLRLYKNILVDYVVYHFLRYRAKKVALDHIDWFFLNRPVMGQMGPYETFSTWSQESQCWEIKFDDLGILLDSLAIDHLLDWDNHLITTMILEYGKDMDRLG